MAAEFIDANWHKPITLGLLSGNTGARTLHEKFKQARGFRRWRSPSRSG